MTTLIEDSPRNLGKWISASATAGVASGAVSTPFATPWVQPGGSGRKPCLTQRAQELTQAGVAVWFDATTHALQMGGVGDFRFYDEYDLWQGQRGDLSTPTLREEHVARVFSIQDAIGAPHLAPTVLLHAGLSGQSELALEIAREAIRLDPDCYLSVAGTAPFWASSSALDAHIGAVAALSPQGWFLTMAQPNNTLPVAASSAEIYGLCRTTRALSEYATVHVSHGDFAALPAIAAGASTVGSGWDKRQRVCSYVDYGPRTQGGGGGGWYERTTLEGILGSLSKSEVALLESRDAPLLASLGGKAAPGPRESFDRHLTVLNDLIADISGQSGYKARYDYLQSLYSSAEVQWSAVVSAARTSTTQAEWITPFAEGLRLYGRSEGW